MSLELGSVELKPVTHPEKSMRERSVYNFCDHRRQLTWPATAGSDLFARVTGMEQALRAGEALNGLGHTVRRLAMGAASEVFQPEVLAGQEGIASQEARISSDFADVIALGEGQVALVFGDVGDKEQFAARCVSQTLSVLRLILSECAHPACALSQLNRYLCGLSLPACPVVALSLTVLDVGTGQVVCACAGSVPPLILRTNGSMETVNAGRTGLGVDAGRAYRAVDFRLGEGDALLLATDGITQARRTNSNGSKDILCYEGLTGLALHAFGEGGPPGLMARKVLEGTRAFAGGTLHDDASVLVAIQR